MIESTLERISRLTPAQAKSEIMMAHATLTMINTVAKLYISMMGAVSIYTAVTTVSKYNRLSERDKKNYSFDFSGPAKLSTGCLLLAGAGYYGARWFSRFITEVQLPALQKVASQGAQGIN